MRSIYVSFFLLLATLTGAQTTATDFTTTDCDGNSRHLFEELDAGKAVVIVWVMPCAPCIGGALTAQTEVQNALAANPGKVVYYLADDYANTSCVTLNKWCATNAITLPVTFSSSKIKMSDYGSDGMPKVVVLGGGSHTVFYNKNAPDITGEGIRNAITAALAAGSTITALTEPSTGFRGAKIYPNPAHLSALLEMETAGAGVYRVTMVSNSGAQVKEVYNGSLDAGKHVFTIGTVGFGAGIYHIVISDGKKQEKLRLVIE